MVEAFYLCAGIRSLFFDNCRKNLSNDTGLAEIYKLSNGHGYKGIIYLHDKTNILDIVRTPKAKLHLNLTFKKLNYNRYQTL